MKKILLLGGSAQQVIAIETARRLGYYTVLCDYLTDNPGQYVADKFYLVSTTDKDAILKVAMVENVDGVLAYASDPAAPTAAYVAEKMGLPTNPYNSVEILCNKDKFRAFLAENGFNSPVACGYINSSEAVKDLGKYRLPVIIKPVDSSGSKGATVLYSWDDVDKAIDFALSFSRDKRFIIEEYVEKYHKYLIGGDVYICDGMITLWGLMNCHRDNAVNPLVPVGKSYPPDIKNKDLESIKCVLQGIVDKLDLKSGAMNVELIVDKNGQVWPIDIGPRSGGNMIPDLIGYIFGVDVVELSVLTAMGETIDMNELTAESFYATHNLHASKNGIFKHVLFSDEAERFIIRKSIYKRDGDVVEYFDNASKALGIVFFKFDSADSMNAVLENINEHINIVLS